MRAPPENSEGPTGANGRPLRDFDSRQRDFAPQSTPAQRTDLDGFRKELATLRAELAIAANLVVDEQPDGTFLVRGWSMSRVVPDLCGLRALVLQLGEQQ